MALDIAAGTGYTQTKWIAQSWASDAPRWDAVIQSWQTGCGIEYAA